MWKLNWLIYKLKKSIQNSMDFFNIYYMIKFEGKSEKNSTIEKSNFDLSIIAIFEKFSKEPLVVNKYYHYGSIYLSLLISLSKTDILSLIEIYKFLDHFEDDRYTLGTIQYLVNGKIPSHYINILQSDKLNVVFISKESIERTKKLSKLDSLNREILRSRFENISFDKGHLVEDIVETAFEDSDILEFIEYSFMPNIDNSNRKLSITMLPNGNFENFISVLELLNSMKKRLDSYRMSISEIYCDSSIAPGRNESSSLSYGSFKKTIIIVFSI